MKTIRRFHERMRRDESGASMVAAIFMLLVMLTAFGVGFDVMRNAFLRSSLENDLDIALAAAAAQVQVDQYGNIRIDKARAQQVFEETYAESRKRYKGLGCQTDPTCFIYLSGSGVSGGIDIDTVNKTISVEILELSNNMWDQFIPDFDAQTPLTIESTSVLRNVNEDRYR